MLDRRRILAGVGTVAATGLVPKALLAAASIKVDDTSALLVIDVQNCFLPGGSLAVKEGDQVVPVINRIAKSFANVVMTQDWHTAGHVSFASVHGGKSRSKPSISPMASRCCGPIIACREPTAPRFRRTFRFRRRSSSFERASTRMSTATPPSPRPTAKPRRDWRVISRPASCNACSSPGSRPISVSHGRRWTRARPGLKPTWSKTRAAASTLRARSPRPGPTWQRPASSAHPIGEHRGLIGR